MKKIFHDGGLVVINERPSGVNTNDLQLCMRTKRRSETQQIIQRRMIALNLANELILPAHGSWTDVEGETSLWNNASLGVYVIDWKVNIRSEKPKQIDRAFFDVCRVLHGLGNWNHQVVTDEEIAEARKSLAKVSGVDGFSPGCPDKEQMALVHSVGIGEIIDNVDMMLDAKDFTLRLTGRDISDAMAEKMYRMIADVYRM